VELFDVNNVYRRYQSSGTWVEATGVSGSHGFSVPDVTVTGPPPDLSGPELLSFSVSPTTVALEGGEITITISAEDETGVDHARVWWTPPSGGANFASCGNFVGNTCTTTVTMGSNGWLAGTHGSFLYGVELFDVNNVYRRYQSSGTWVEATGVSGSHGFSVPDVTVTGPP
jgi:hypothetical protein